MREIVMFRLPKRLPEKHFDQKFKDSEQCLKWRCKRKKRFSDMDWIILRCVLQGRVLVRLANIFDIIAQDWLAQQVRNLVACDE